MNTTIHQTTISPTKSGSIVQMHISDAPLEAEHAEVVVKLTVTLPKYAGPLLLAQAQREAIRTAQLILSQQADALMREIGQTNADLEPLPLVLTSG